MQSMHLISGGAVIIYLIFYYFLRVTYNFIYKSHTALE